MSQGFDFDQLSEEQKKKIFDGFLAHLETDKAAQDKIVALAMKKFMGGGLGGLFGGRKAGG